MDKYMIAYLAIGLLWATWLFLRKLDGIVGAAHQFGDDVEDAGIGGHTSSLIVSLIVLSIWALHVVLWPASVLTRKRG